MAITLQQLHNRYIKANKELDSYGMRMSDKLANGTASKKDIMKFNLMSAWISFMGPKINPPIVQKGVAPTSIKLPIPISSQIVSNKSRNIAIGIENYNGRYIPLLRFRDYKEPIYSGSELPNGWVEVYSYFEVNVRKYLETYSDTLNYIDDSGVNRGKFSIHLTPNDRRYFRISFPKTSDFNNQKFSATRNIAGGFYHGVLQADEGEDYTLLDNTQSMKISGGVNEYSVGKSLDLKEIDVYNKALEDISIELNISY